MSEERKKAAPVIPKDYSPSNEAREIYNFFWGLVTLKGTPTYGIYLKELQKLQNPSSSEAHGPDKHILANIVENIRLGIPPRNQKESETSAFPPKRQLQFQIDELTPEFKKALIQFVNTIESEEATQREAVEREATISASEEKEAAQSVSEGKRGAENRRTAAIKDLQEYFDSTDFGLIPDLPTQKGNDLVVQIKHRGQQLEGLDDEELFMLETALVGKSNKKPEESLSDKAKRNPKATALLIITGLTTAALAVAAAVETKSVFTTLAYANATLTLCFIVSALYLRLDTGSFLSREGAPATFITSTTFMLGLAAGAGLYALYATLSLALQHQTISGSNLAQMMNSPTTFYAADATAFLVVFLVNYLVKRYIQKNEKIESQKRLGDEEQGDKMAKDADQDIPNTASKAG